MPTLIKTTQDGRKVEVKGLAICLDGQLEACELIEVKQHPNRAAILQAAPEARYMAGRITLTEDEAETVRQAFAEVEEQILVSPTAINERFRLAVKRRMQIEGIE